MEIKMHFTTLLFDLDETLYQSTSGLWHAIRNRMTEFMFERLDLPREKIPEMRQYYFENYGTTLRGLQHDFNIDADDYLVYVHDLPLEKYIYPDPILRDVLLSLPQQRWIFTNADAAHAQRVLSVLELQDCFVGIIDVHALDFLCKPDREAYMGALKIIHESNPVNCVIFDDSARNLAPAHELGFYTVLVGKAENHPGVDRSILRLHDLPDLMPELWHNGSNAQ